MNDIVFITDNQYVMPTVITITSIAVSAKEKCKDYVFHICAFSLSKENISLLKRLRDDGIQVLIHMQTADRYRDKFAKISQNSHVTPTALLKFELPDILADLDKILYLDSDIIVKRSLGDLFQIDLQDYYVAASFEYWKYLLKVYEYKEEPEIPDFYFNSGVMLLNLKKMREEHTGEKLWEKKISSYNNMHNKGFGLMDQDVFNDVFSGNVYRLPIRYNCNCRFLQEDNLKGINKVYSTSYKLVQELYEDACIIHYVGKEDKPWIYETANCRNLWDSIYDQSLFAGQALSRKKPKRSLMYFFRATMQSMRTRGLIATIRYVMDKR